MNRQFFVLMHRYIGLVMALFLAIAGFTGMFLAFYNELDAYINRNIAYVQPPSVNAQALDPFTLRDKVAAAYPQASFNWIELKYEAGRSVVFNPVPKTKALFKLEYDQIYVNPYTAKVVGGRNWGKITEGFSNLMPFVYQLHYSLALGTIGNYAFGIIALLWTIDCFVGTYLTFPAKQKKQVSLPQPNHLPKGEEAKHSKTWLNRWATSWKIRWQGGSYKVSFDLHRAGGLWFWAMLFVFAWSSVGFNLQEVYNPVTKVIFETQKSVEDLPTLAKPLEQPALSFRQAYAIAQALMASEAKAKNFTVIAPTNLGYDATKGYYQYRVKSSMDVSEKYGGTAIYFDASTGKKLLSYLPSTAASGNTVSEWLFALHMASIWGLPMKIFISLMGAVVTGLTITGIYTWLKKRKARKFSFKSHQSQKS